MNSQPPLFRRLRQARPGFAPRRWLKLLLLVGALALGVEPPVQAVQTICNLFVATEGGAWGSNANGSGPEDNNWTWSLDGVSMSGEYLWYCGYYYDGGQAFSSCETNLDLTPNTPYFCSVSADSDICSAYAFIWPPSCYDVYVTDMQRTNLGAIDVSDGNYDWADYTWRGGYQYGFTVSPDPNESPL